MPKPPVVKLATIAYHNKPIKRKTVMSILKSANISVEELKELF